MTQPLILHNQQDQRFYVPLGQEEAELTYNHLPEGVVDLDYTYIPPQHRHQGIADQLVKAALDYVQAHQLKFVPSCPVVEAYVKRHPQYLAYQQKV